MLLMVPGVLSSALTCGRAHSVILWCVFKYNFLLSPVTSTFFFLIFLKKSSMSVTIRLNAFDIAMVFFIEEQKTKKHFFFKLYVFIIFYEPAMTTTKLSLVG